MFFVPASSALFWPIKKQVLRRWGGVVVFFLLVSGCGGSSLFKRVDTTPIHGRHYRVKTGDTLYSVARRAGLNYKTLARWNRIRSPYTIYSGQRLHLHPPAKSRRPSVKSTKASRRPKSKKIKKNFKKKLKVVWQWPLKGVIVRNFHQTGGKGIDIKAPPGTPVRAIGNGSVVYSGSGLVGYGNLVIVKHDEIYLSAYGNNRRLLVKEGQRVKKGQIIAEVGQGRGRRSVLHFEIRKRGKPVNPLHYLPRR
ncbi:MAG TPA: LysM peptidoglycan-binding domain-containing protein [Methylothermaceae bacterium]|nr:LysM peptidoglycan-binding domain-containing protein [Methylothermaceae bacterium]